MSHANGYIYDLPGNLIGFFEYNGTVDFACSRVYATFAEMRENWRGDNLRHCLCAFGKSDLPIILYTDYGGGFVWLGVICTNCKAITSGQEPGSPLGGSPFWIDGEERLMVTK